MDFARRVAKMRVKVAPPTARLPRGTLWMGCISARPCRTDLAADKLAAIARPAGRFR